MTTFVLRREQITSLNIEEWSGETVIDYVDDDGNEVTARLVLDPVEVERLLALVTDRSEYKDALGRSPLADL
jgi:hypothetical protein